MLAGCDRGCWPHAVVCTIESEVRATLTEQLHAARAQKGGFIVDTLQICLEARHRQVRATSKSAYAIHYM